MKNLLDKIFEKAIKLDHFKFNEKQIKNSWLGNKPASDSEIKRTEKRLGIELPLDYKELLKITNGFSAPVTVEPTFEPIEKIDYLKNIDSYIIEIWSQEAIADIGKLLEKSIIIGGISEEQYFLLIPPNIKNKQWKYWTFASWYPGENEHKNLICYLEDLLKFINDEIETE